MAERLVLGAGRWERVLKSLFGRKKPDSSDALVVAQPTADPAGPKNAKQPIFLWGSVLREHKGYLPVPRIFFRAFRHLGISPDAALLLLNLMSRKSAKNPQPCPSVRTLAAELALSERSVRYHLKALEKKGLLKRGYRNDGHGKNQTSLYDLGPAQDALRRAARMYEKAATERSQDDVPK